MSLLCLSVCLLLLSMHHSPPPSPLYPPFPLRVCKVTTHAAGLCVCVCVCVWHLHIVSILDLCQSSAPSSIHTTLCWRGTPCLQLLCKFTKCKLHATKAFSLLSRTAIGPCVCVCLFVCMCVLVNGKLKNSIQSFLYSLQLLSHAPLNQQLFIYYVCFFLLSRSLSLLSLSSLRFAHLPFSFRGPKETQPRCVSSPSTPSLPRGKCENVFFMHLLNGKEGKRGGRG